VSQQDGPSEPPPKPPLRILIADDHEIVRRGLRNVIAERKDWQVCGEAANGRRAIELARALRPDVVVIDLQMPELNGLEATRRIHAMLPKTEVLICSMHESDALIREVLSAGARGYLLKSDAAQLILAAIEALAEHKPFLGSRIAESVLEVFLQTAQAESPSSPTMLLSGREREIVQLLAEGNSNKKISAALGISLKTVETHRAMIMRKLGIKSITELVRYAMRNSLIPP
jgi:DNA-binding NarL/FixJ family response regulator